jgi:hypothetical protein
MSRIEIYVPPAEIVIIYIPRTNGTDCVRVLRASPTARGPRERERGYCRAAAERGAALLKVKMENGLCAE